jgi:uncharacterized protein
MEANPNIKNWSNNTFQTYFDGENEISLLKTVAIYGANASGKSNFLRAFSSFLNLLSTSASNNLEDKLEYDPFLLDKSIEGQPTIYFFDFIGSNRSRYQYSFSHNSNKIVEESLGRFSGNKLKPLFNRKNDVIIYLDETLKEKNISSKIIPPRLFLSDLANNQAEEISGDIYRNIQKIISANLTSDKSRKDILSFTLKGMVENSGDNPLSNLVNLLISNADIQTLSMGVEKNVPYTLHKLFNKTEEDGTKKLSFDLTASDGTKIFIGMIGVLSRMIRDGVPFICDEINASLHPDLCRALIRLLSDKNFNEDNAQLIFSTHDISLLEKTFLRNDQVWFTEKNKYGSTELYSAQDFENIPVNVSLGKLYDSGFFRAKPRINETRIKLEK